MPDIIPIGIIGCGSISNAYFGACKRFPLLQVAACADIDLERAKAKAAEHGVGRACTVDEMLADPAIQIIVNLTIPKAHAEVDLRILNAGKHVFSEKPFAISREEGKAIVELAKKKNLRVGCAPDTVMGCGVQTCRKYIDEGVIGKVIAGNAFMLCGGHETWHPSPEFYYEVGGGPMFDMGPYYLHALITLLGPVKRVSGVANTTFPERTITSQPKRGKVVRTRRHRGLDPGPRSQRHRRPDPHRPSRRTRLGRIPAHSSLQGRLARRRRRRHGDGHPQRAPAPRQRRDRLPRPRHHAGRPRGVEVRHLHHPHHHLRTTGGDAGGVAGLDPRPLIGSDFGGCASRDNESRT